MQVPCHGRIRLFFAERGESRGRCRRNRILQDVYSPSRSPLPGKCDTIAAPVLCRDARNPLGPVRNMCALLLGSTVCPPRNLRKRPRKIRRHAFCRGKFREGRRLLLLGTGFAPRTADRVSREPRSVAATAIQPLIGDCRNRRRAGITRTTEPGNSRPTPFSGARRGRRATAKLLPRPPVAAPLFF